MRQEPLTEIHDGGFHAVAQPVECTGTRGGGVLAPLFEHALLGWITLEAAAMASEPQQREVAVQLALEDGMQVEFDVGLTGKRSVVPQESQRQAVGEQRPEMVVAAVEKFLHQAVRRGSSCPGHSWGASINGNLRAQQVDGNRVAPLVGDGVLLAVDLAGPSCRQSAESQLIAERVQPTLPCQPGGSEVILRS